MAGLHINKRRKESTIARMLGVIDSNVKRYGKIDPKTNCYESAEFEFGNVNYHITGDGDIYHKSRHTGWEWQELALAWVKDGIYPTISINNCILFAYHVVLTALNPDFYENYMSDSRLVVNHLLVEEYRIAHVGYSGASRPMRSFATNPKFLEVITRGQNTRHGKFVERYGLWGIAIKSEEVDVLESLLDRLSPQDDYSDYVSSLYADEADIDPRDFRFCLA